MSGCFVSSCPKNFRAQSDPVLFCASDNKRLKPGLELNNQKAYCLGRFMAEAMPTKLVTVVPRVADNVFILQ